MTPKKTNPLKLEDILFNLCKQVEQQNEAKFFRWNCIILSCIGLLMSILMWWCE